MTTLQLRNHIPIAGPARREAADGTEAPMRVSLGFEPAWFHTRCGVEFDERWHTDPVYRHDSLVACKRELKRAFPSIDYWDALSDADMWTLSGVYGAYVVARLFGAELIYGVDRWPTPPRPMFTLDDLNRIDIEKLLSNELVADLQRQMGVIERESGRIHGYLNWQGVLNNAFILIGQDIFTEMVERPALVHRVFDFISDVMIRFATMIQSRQSASGFSVDHLSVSNCTINMMSPKFCREFVFPYDRKIAEHFTRFGVHTCNWNATPYLKEIAQLPNVGYIDMGIETNLAQAKTLFPEARRAVMYSPVKLQDATHAEIENDLRKIHDVLAPCDIVMADIQVTTPDARVNEFVEFSRILSGSN
ncbi:MAG: hypothetical protein HZB51_14420 [Chloroflexi bacterium]|nr:hypothetical protein [Chloroflexota bacterium]